MTISILTAQYLWMSIYCTINNFQLQNNHQMLILSTQYECDPRPNACHHKLLHHFISTPLNWEGWTWGLTHNIIVLWIFSLSTQSYYANKQFRGNKRDNGPWNKQNHLPINFKHQKYFFLLAIRNAIWIGSSLNDHERLLMPSINYHTSAHIDSARG